ncbi:hypothetical protein [Roseateles sp. MS654]|uniref:hypothetical protein n=1 Tax=Roseateles sp. MS654 TaxID=3412685 RepID=UPI003C30894B
MVLASSMPKYAPAEAAAAAMFNRSESLPPGARERFWFTKDCAEYVRRYTELGGCPEFASMLHERFKELSHRFANDRPTDRESHDMAQEACSMAASLTSRFGPPGTAFIKAYSSPPGNIPELLDVLGYQDLRRVVDGTRCRLEDGPYLSKAKKIDRKKPDARKLMMQVYQDWLDQNPKFQSTNRDHLLGPNPDALIAAARNGQSFDTVRKQMLLEEASPGGDLHSCY